MKKIIRFSTMLAMVIVAVQTVLAAAPANYYNGAVGKSNEALMTALRNIIHSHTEVSYSSGLLKAFAKADVDAQGYIIDIYSNCRYSPSDNGSSASHVGEGYNREHSFPRSWFGGEVAPMNTDVFHIYPTDICVNSQRSNFPYGVCANGTRLSYGSYVAKGKLGTCTYPGYTGTVFEPDDEYKGDLARSYFYMVTCYKNELPSWPGSAQLDYSKNRYKAFSTWTINMLMEWTRLDPVSEKEIKRNEAVYGIQGNR
ncbi:MAG: endonuclease, partial [Bacteroidales bacterium]|nr:endonuclease [Bacteroidales bacterium]